MFALDLLRTAANLFRLSLFTLYNNYDSWEMDTSKIGFKYKTYNTIMNFWGKMFTVGVESFKFESNIYVLPLLVTFHEYLLNKLINPYRVCSKIDTQYKTTSYFEYKYGASSTSGCI